jgi:PHP domain
VTRPIRLALFAFLLVLAALAAVAPQLLPPPAATTPAPHWPASGITVRGAYHVHSTLSDGTGSIDEIAAAAARAGLKFVILTDHGDGTRVPGPPSYRSGVLCVEAVEVNTTGGHLVALGARPSPFPLAGTPRAVLEDVQRLGGIGIAAHPESPRRSLRWSGWEVPVDGIEWLNADSEWRDELLASLGRLLLTYALRPAGTLTAALDRPDAALARWDQATAQGRVVGLAGADAHARLGFRQQTDPFEEGWHLKVPSYEASFKAFSLRVLLDAPLSGDAARDAQDILTRVRRGRTYTVIDGLATPGGFEFTATSGGRTAGIGDDLDIAGEVILHARMAAPPGSRMAILRNGVILFDTREPESHVGVMAEPAVYRVEIDAPGTGGEPPIPWLVSNPIYVGMRAAHERARLAPVRTATANRASIATEAWVAEASPGSASRLLPHGMAAGVAVIEWEHQIAGGAVSGQYSAVRFPLNGLQHRDRLQLRLRADRPMRIWVQVRSSTTGSGERWGQSIYLDDAFRTVDVFFDQFQPLGATSSATPPLDAVDALLLVVDTLNSRPGDAGRVQIAELWLGQP